MYTQSSNACRSDIVLFPENVVVDDHIRFIYLTKQTVQRPFYEEASITGLHLL